MSLEVDLLLDRRRLKRRLVFWRVCAILAAVAAALITVRGGGLLPVGPHVARLSISGLITEDHKLVERIEALADDSQTRALIVDIDSPGGSVAGGETLHDAISAVAARKPVVAVMGGLAASAGYMIAVPAHHIFAREGTLTGSIGVFLQSGEISGLLDKLGVTTEVVRSGPLKDEPSFLHPLSPAGRTVLQGLVNDMYDQFVQMVASGRHMNADAVRQLGDGRPYTGRQALALGLIDGIGGERDARKWLAAEKGIPSGLPVRDISTGSYASRALSGRFDGVVNLLWKALVSQSVRLDGAWALWQRSDK